MTARQLFSSDEHQRGGMHDCPMNSCATNRPLWSEPAPFVQPRALIDFSTSRLS